MTAKNWIRLDGKKYFLGPGEKALDALLRQGAPLTFSCRKGSCQSCMLQATSGDPGAAAVATLPQEYRDQGLFLPCCATDVCEVEARQPEQSQFVHEAQLAGTIMLAPDILQLRLELTRELIWRPGQVIQLMNPAGVTRNYSIVSRPEDYFLTIDIRVYPGGEVSGWAKTLAVGDTVRFSGPGGALVWTEDMADRPLVLIGTGSGGGVLAGIARDAIARGHKGTIRLFHGGRKAADLYLGDQIAELPEGRLQLVQAASQEAFGAQAPARITDLAFASGEDLSRAVVFLAGNPDMIETARIAAVRAGVALEHIHADPFDSPEPYETTENQKLQAIQPDPELWAALGEGELLTAILTEFYGEVYEHPQIAPFFHRTTKQRAIEKQFSFLQDLFSGTRLYFGEKPFNSHHWMVISDELFDIRERLFFDVVRRHGISEDMIRRWGAIHETFRREIVKSTPRGILRGGTEVSLEGYSHECLDVGSVCDGCFGEIPAGAVVLMHTRTGEVFCTSCEGQRSDHAA